MSGGCAATTVRYLRLKPDLKQPRLGRPDGDGLSGPHNQASECQARTAKPVSRCAAKVAIDGSRFKAVNSRDKNYTTGKIDKRRQPIEESVQRYLDAIETADRTTPTGFDVKTVHLYEKIARLRREMREFARIKKQLQKHPDKQLSMTDPDARSMATSGRGSGIVGYNVQVAVDTKHHLIVEHEVTNIGNDHGQLGRMAASRKERDGQAEAEGAAARGYFGGPEIRACELNDTSAYVPKPLTSASRKKGLFTKADLVYLAKDDVYRCSAGERAIHRFNTVENGMNLRVYWPSACPRCPLKQRCSPSHYRRIRRWELNIFGVSGTMKSMKLVGS
ncbi:hypothetical protein BN2476_930049 [Paraburkholderia piptadeniae]|uniref:Transposase n=1 Tax=Paraburkholderia piptadeniae TaxID=1701573 RepID=A0A1N7STF0_9BURK|nr:hypothetical protein BN2476_930049 [Paraburkholderia piptadeniae]